MSHQFTLPGTRCTIKLQQPRRDYKNKNHLHADGTVKPDFILMQGHIDDVTARMLKCTGKHKRQTPRGGVSRVYPPHGAAMNTRDYAAQFYEVNNLYGSKSLHVDEKNKLAYIQGLFEPLSTSPQTWPDEPLFEEIEE